MEDALDTIMFYYSCFLRCSCVCRDVIVFGDAPQNGRLKKARACKIRTRWLLLQNLQYKLLLYFLKDVLKCQIFILIVIVTETAWRFICIL